MKFVIFDGETLLGSFPDVDAVKRVKKAYIADTNRTPRIYCNIDGELKEWGDNE